MPNKEHPMRTVVGGCPSPCEAAGGRGEDWLQYNKDSAFMADSRASRHTPPSEPGTNSLYLARLGCVSSADPSSRSR